MAANKQAKQKLLLDALRTGNTIRAATAYAGVNQDTFFEWRKDPRFSEQVETAQATAEIRAVTGVVKAGSKSWQAFAWWLRHHPRTRADWREVHDINWRDISAEQLLLLAGDGPEGVDSPGDRLAVTGAEARTLASEGDAPS